MKEYVVIMRISGRASAVVTADSPAEARKKVRNGDIDDSTDELIEWEFEFDEPITIEEA